MNRPSAEEETRTKAQLGWAIREALSCWVLAALTQGAGVAQQPPPFNTPQGLEGFFQSYYLQPRPQLIPDAVVGLHSSGILHNTNARPPIVAFFSEIFSAHRDHVPRWRTLIQKQGEPTTETLERALALSRAGGALHLEGHSPELNDMYWGGFFASGNPEYLRKLVDQLRYFDEREDFHLFMAGATAKWSLASNAHSHDLVRSTLERTQSNVDKRTRELVAELLAQEPDDVKREIQEIVNQQRKAGKWR